MHEVPDRPIHNRGEPGFGRVLLFQGPSPQIAARSANLPDQSLLAVDGRKPDVAARQYESGTFGTEASNIVPSPYLRNATLPANGPCVIFEVVNLIRDRSEASPPFVSRLVGRIDAGRSVRKRAGFACRHHCPVWADRRSDTGGSRVGAAGKEHRRQSRQEWSHFISLSRCCRPCNSKLAVRIPPMAGRSTSNGPPLTEHKAPNIRGAPSYLRVCHGSGPSAPRAAPAGMRGGEIVPSRPARPCARISSRRSRR